MFAHLLHFFQWIEIRQEKEMNFKDLSTQWSLLTFFFFIFSLLKNKYSVLGF